jgi:hypothetical protein
MSKSLNQADVQPNQDNKKVSLPFLLSFLFNAMLFCDFGLEGLDLQYKRVLWAPFTGSETFKRMF